MTRVFVAKPLQADESHTPDAEAFAHGIDESSSLLEVRTRIALGTEYIERKVQAVTYRAIYDLHDDLQLAARQLGIDRATLSRWTEKPTDPKNRFRVDSRLWVPGRDASDIPLSQDIDVQYPEEGKINIRLLIEKHRGKVLDTVWALIITHLSDTYSDHEEVGKLLGNGKPLSPSTVRKKLVDAKIVLGGSEARSPQDRIATAAMQSTAGERTEGNEQMSTVLRPSKWTREEWITALCDGKMPDGTPLAAKVEWLTEDDDASVPIPYDTVMHPSDNRFIEYAGPKPDLHLSVARNETGHVYYLCTVPANGVVYRVDGDYRKFDDYTDGKNYRSGKRHYFTVPTRIFVGSHLTRQYRPQDA